MKRSLLLCPVLFLSGSLSGLYSWATLGQSVKSVEINSRDLHAKTLKPSQEKLSHNKLSHDKLSHDKLYQVYVLTSEMNEVRQYLDPQGIVFAVTWRGLNHPDLSKLLGDFFKDYYAADEQISSSRGQLSKRIRTEQIVVETSGHMGTVRGRAYLVRSIPKGLSIESLS